MARPTITVVGLGPSSESLMTLSATEKIRNASVARLRTQRHPAALSFADIPSYDDDYENAESFESLYEHIVADLVRLAKGAPDRHVVYAVPGSPLVAESTVTLLRQQSDIDVLVEPALSVIDVACGAMGRDPMSCSLRIVDALASSQPLRGPGPLLVLQTYSPEVLAVVADRLDPATLVTVLFHLGAPEQRIIELPARALATFSEADHLTSLWIDELRTPGVALEDLVEFTHTLRERCAWDQEQTHGSLLRHLLEETYETIDALERYVAQLDDDSRSVDASDVVEELGDLLFQIMFHAEIGDEDGHFNFTSIADTVREKLTSRHPHVFGDVEANTADEVAARWEDNKLREKGRSSVTEGVPLDLPALVLYAKLRRKSVALGVPLENGELSRARALMLLTSLRVGDEPSNDAQLDGTFEPAWGELLGALSDLARWTGVDLESTLRRRALALREEILGFETGNSS